MRIIFHIAWFILDLLLIVTFVMSNETGTMILSFIMLLCSGTMLISDMKHQEAHKPETDRRSIWKFR